MFSTLLPGGTLAIVGPTIFVGPWPGLFTVAVPRGMVQVAAQAVKAIQMGFAGAGS